MQHRRPILFKPGSPGSPVNQAKKAKMARMKREPRSFQAELRSEARGVDGINLYVTQDIKMETPILAEDLKVVDIYCDVNRDRYDSYQLQDVVTDPLMVKEPSELDSSMMAGLAELGLLDFDKPKRKSSKPRAKRLQGQKTLTDCYKPPAKKGKISIHKKQRN